MTAPHRHIVRSDAEFCPAKYDLETHFLDPVHATNVSCQHGKLDPQTRDWTNGIANFACTQYTFESDFSKSGPETSNRLSVLL